MIPTDSQPKGECGYEWFDALGRTHKNHRCTRSPHHSIVHRCNCGAATWLPDKTPDEKPKSRLTMTEDDGTVHHVDPLLDR